MIRFSKAWMNKDHFVTIHGEHLIFSFPWDPNDHKKGRGELHIIGEIIRLLHIIPCNDPNLDTTVLLHIDREKYIEFYNFGCAEIKSEEMRYSYLDREFVFTREDHGLVIFLSNDLWVRLS